MYVCVCSTDCIIKYSTNQDKLALGKEEQLRHVPSFGTSVA